MTRFTKFDETITFEQILSKTIASVPGPTGDDNRFFQVDKSVAVDPDSMERNPEERIAAAATSGRRSFTEEEKEFLERRRKLRQTREGERNFAGASIILIF
jgi:hypothetical protein